MIRAGIAIADRDGVERLTMREVADVLGVGTMSLYHYVRSKGELLALMDDHVMGEMLIDPPLPASWRAAVVRIARRSREVLLRHPWAVTGMHGSGLSENTLRRFEQSLAATARTSLSPGERLDLIATVTDYVCGFVLKSDLEPDTEAVPDGEAADAFLRSRLASGDYPHLSALTGGRDSLPALAHALSTTTNTSRRFEQGLAQLLDGMARQWSVPDEPHPS